LKIPVTAEIRLWHLHPFVNSHFHFLTVVKLADSQMSRQRAQNASQTQPLKKEKGLQWCKHVSAHQGPNFYPDEIFKLLP
jgi:hypothetical protein